MPDVKTRPFRRVFDVVRLLSSVFPEDLDEESGWVEVRWQKETGHFPRRASVERRESSWRGVRDEYPTDKHATAAAEPYYRHLLTHPGGASSDETGRRSSKDYQSEEGLLQRCSSDPATSSCGSGLCGRGSGESGGEKTREGSEGETAGRRRRHKGRGRGGDGGRDRRDSRDSWLETWGRAEPFREVEPGGGVRGGRWSFKDDVDTPGKWGEDIELREVPARPPGGLWRKGEKETEGEGEGSMHGEIGGVDGKGGKETGIDRELREDEKRGERVLREGKEREAPGQSAGEDKRKNGTEEGWEEEHEKKRSVSEAVDCYDIPAAVSSESPPHSAVCTARIIDVGKNWGPDSDGREAGDQARRSSSTPSSSGSAKQQQRQQRNPLSGDEAKEKEDDSEGKVRADGMTRETISALSEANDLLTDGPGNGGPQGKSEGTGTGEVHPNRLHTRRAVVDLL